MRLWCYHDLTGWGGRVRDAARERGHTASLFTTARQVGEGHAFVRMHLRPTSRDREKQLVIDLAALPGVRVTPSARAAHLYDDKILQTEQLSRWMPPTIVARTRDDAVAAVGQLGLPLMSKTSEGSASANVRLLRTPEQVAWEIEAAFGGAGITGQYGRAQSGYLLLQEFCAGNTGDFRVIAVGRERLILRRGNRPDRPMASGSDTEIPVVWPDEEASEVLSLANRFFDEEDLKFCGIDIVRDHRRGRWVILECTASWPSKNNAAHRTVSGRSWGDFFRIVAEEMEAGTC